MGLILVAFLLGQGVFHAQTSEKLHEGTYNLSFSTYLSHTDKYAASFDVVTDSRFMEPPT